MSYTSRFMGLSSPFLRRAMKSVFFSLRFEYCAMEEDRLNALSASRFFLNADILDSHASHPVLRDSLAPAT
jgi:hypothetical protein